MCVHGHTCPIVCMCTMHLQVPREDRRGDQISWNWAAWYGSWDWNPGPPQEQMLSITELLLQPPSRWTWPHVWTHHSSTVCPDAFAISCVIQIGNDNWQVNACKGWGNTLPWSLWKTGQIHTQGDSSAMRRGMGKMLVEFWQNACFHIWQRQRGRPTGPVLLGSQALRDPHKGAITVLLHECWEKHVRHRDGT